MTQRWHLHGRDDALDPLDALSYHLNAPMCSGNDFQHYKNGDAIFPAMLDAIREARDTINLLSYIYGEGDIAERFAEELISAVKRGVEVRLLVDAVGGLELEGRVVKALEKGGVRFAWFHPLRFGRLFRVNNRTHRKVMVVDGTVGFTGGVGISPEWTGDAQDSKHWRDDHVRVTGPVVKAMQGAFGENWRRATGEHLVGRRMFPNIEPTGEADVLPIFGGPHASPDFSLVYWTLVELAKKKLRIATPYFVPPDDIFDAMKGSLDRGVELTLMVPDSHTDWKLVQYASRTFHRPLIEGGARLFRYRGTLMHAKLVVVDDRYSLVGSPNMDMRSFELNYEFALLARDPGFASVLNQSFDEDLQQSTEITAEEIEGRSFFGNLRDSAAALLRGQL